MKPSHQEREYLLHLAMQANSLHDLLGILNNISEKLKFTQSKRLVQYRAFQFTFFGLMARVNSILHLMLFRCDYLREHDKRYELIYGQLYRLRTTAERATVHIGKNDVQAGTARIIEAAQQYEATYALIEKRAQERLAR